VEYEGSDAADVESLRERDARLRALLEIAFDGTILSENGVVVEFSQRLLGISGYQREEVIGRPLTDFLATEFHETLRQRQAAGTEGRFEAVGVLKDGSRRTVEIVTRNHIVRGRTVRITALRDVTEKRRLEEQVRQSQKMEALGRLASGVAHDFNNVLTLIGSYADLLLERPDGPHLDEAMEIRKAVEFGATLSRQLLAYGRLRNETVTEIDVNAVVRDAERLLRRLIGPGVTLAAELAPGRVMVRADGGQLQQLLFNLALNASDAMPDGGSLVVRTGCVEFEADQLRGYSPARPGRYAMLALSDSGMGIPADVKAHMFEPFFTTKDPERGTGLGLSVVKDVVERHNGFIVVDSTLKAGTTIAIYLPMLEQ
jgi:two-component system cell cycle sensor histidine kinase/response regulator CckA